MAFKIGLQAYSVREDMEKNFAATMKQIKDMGYDGVELAGVFGHSAAYVKEVADELDLEIFSAHVPLSDMLEKPQETFSYYQQIGCTYIAIPWLGEGYRPGQEHFAWQVENTAKAGELAKSYGLQLLHHNHDFEFWKVGDEYGLDYMYRTIPSDLLQPELDTCWVNIGGEDPAEYIMKYKNRVDVVHLKDFYKPDGVSGEGMYELIGIEKPAVTNTGFEFRAVGHGMQNIPFIVNAAQAAGAQWLVVEQDRPSQGLTPMEAADISIKYLHSIGL